MSNHITQRVGRALSGELTTNAKGWRADASIVWVLAFAMLAAISRRTLWIDEFSTAAIAAIPNPLRALDFARTELGSEGLMPAWVVLTNLLGRLAGTSELALRAVNAVMLFASVHLMSRIGPRRMNVGPAMLFAISPFVWYYGHEARPYALQLLLGAFWTYAAWRSISSRGHEGRLYLLVSTAALVYCSLTSAVIGIGLTVVTVLALWRTDGRWPFSLRSTFLGSALLLPGIFYYGYAVLFQGTTSAKLWQVGIGNLAFAAYELLGFVGMGPGRLELREAGLHGLSAVVDQLFAYLTPLSLLGLAWLATLIVLSTLDRSKSLGSDRIHYRFTLIVSLAVAISSAALFGASYAAEFPVWGRHFAPVLPAMVATLGLSLQRMALSPLARTRALVGIGASGLLAALLIASSLQVRFAERHWVEDYRTAASLAATSMAMELPVSWFATELALDYYLEESGRSDLLSYQQVPDQDASSARLLVVSKPDIHDPDGIVAAKLQAQSNSISCEFRPRGFQAVLINDENATACELMGQLLPQLGDLR